MTHFLSMLLVTPEILGSIELKQLLVIVVVTIITSAMYVLATSGSYQPTHENQWVARWSQKNDTRAILVINTLFIIMCIANSIFKIIPVEPLQVGIQFAVVFFCSLSVKLIRYYTDIKKERPSAW